MSILPAIPLLRVIAKSLALQNKIATLQLINQARTSEAPGDFNEALHLDSQAEKLQAQASSL